MIAILVVIYDLLELPLVVVVLYLGVIVKASSHLMVLLLARKGRRTLETRALRIIFLGGACSLMGLVIDLAIVGTICKLLIAELSV